MTHPAVKQANLYLNKEQATKYSHRNAKRVKYRFQYMIDGKTYMTEDLAKILGMTQASVADKLSKLRKQPGPVTMEKLRRK